MSEPATILVVEDNPITRKMVRLALSAEGYRVLEAQNGAAALEILDAERPAAVLLDLTLPDAHGFEVLAKIRARAGGAEIPVIAVTGFLPGDDQARAAAAGFDQILIKPLEPSHLVEVVRAYARVPRGGAAAPARGKRVLVVDDDPVQLKLSRLQIEELGFEVATAANGVEALAAARRSRPDAIVSDVLMPRLDGFKLCLAIREDPALGRTPVVLQSSKFTEEADRVLAFKVGANAYVERDPEGTEVGKAVLASLLAAEPPPFEDVTSESYSEYLDRIVHQLERQVAMNRGLVQRNIQLASSLSVLGAASDALARRQSLDDTLSEMFHRCIDSVGASLGIFYVADEGQIGFRVQSLVGVPSSARSAADSCFGHPELLELTHEKALRVPSPDLPEGTSEDLLARLGLKAAILTPILFGDERLGVLLIGTEARDLPGEDLLGFAKVVGGQIGQSLALGRAFEALESAHAENARLAAIVESSEEAILGNALDGTVESWNRGAEAQYGYSAAEMIGQPVSRILPPERSHEMVEIIERIVRGEHVDSHETERVRKDGKRMTVSLTASPILDSAGRISGVATIARDVTERNAAAEKLRRALARAQESDRLKTAFLANMSHEVRTPLNVILGYNSIIAEHLAGLHDETLTLCLEAVSEGSDRLLETIQGIVDLSRFESETFEVWPEPVKLIPLVEKSIRQFRKPAEKKHLSLACEIEVPDAEVRVDEYCLEQSFHRLLDNAIKFTQEGGVVVRLHRDPTGALCLTVRDTGVGIDPSYLPNLFKPFSQEHDGYTRRFEGPGIGLALVKRYLDMSRAEIAVQSEKGKGTTVTIRLAASAESVVEDSPAGRLH